MIKKMLLAHEGLRLHPYKCSAGKTTIGIGRNLEDNGITEAEANVLLENDIERVRRELAGFHWFSDLDDVRQCVLIDMCFNLGISRLRGFRNTLAAIESGDYQRAAAEMVDSKWARQVGRRAEHLRYMMETGQFHPIFEA